MLEAAGPSPLILSRISILGGGVPLTLSGSSGILSVFTIGRAVDASECIPLSLVVGMVTTDCGGDTAMVGGVIEVARRVVLGVL